MEDKPDLVTKVERLQKDLSWMKCIATVLFLCVAVGIVATWTRHPRIVEASEFLVRDRTGKVVARLGQFDLGDTCLTLTADQNVSVANLCVQNDQGASLDLHNLKSESRATLTPGFNTYEPTFHFQAGLTIVENGHEIGGISSNTIKKSD